MANPCMFSRLLPSNPEAEKSNDHFGKRKQLSKRIFMIKKIICYLIGRMIWEILLI